VEADEVLVLFAREVVGDAIALAASGNVPITSPTPTPGFPPPPAPVRTGAGAVHPHLGQHLITPLKHDTISGHAYAHTPRALPLQVPDARTTQLLQTQDELGKQQAAMDRVKEYRQAAAELDRHSADLQKRGIALPGTWKPWTPEEHASHAAYADDTITKALDNGMATSRTHTLGGTGQVWTPERASHHKDIVSQAVDRAVNVPSGHRGVLVGGLATPTRTSVARQVAPTKDYLHVNTDDIKKELAARGLIPDLPGLSPAEASPLVHDESEHIADLITREALRRGKNVAIHTPMSDPSAIRAHADRLRQAGHTVHGVFVHTLPGKAAAAARSSHKSGHESWRQQKSAGSPYRSPALVRAAETSAGSSVNSEAFEAAKKHLGSWEHWDATSALKKTASSSQQVPSGVPTVEELARGE
jgi:predicted kinase